MRDGLILGIAVFFILGGVYPAYAAYDFTQHAAQGHACEVRPVPDGCEDALMWMHLSYNPQHLAVMFALSAFFILTGTTLLFIWFGGAGDADAPARRADGEAGTGPGVVR